MREAVCTVDDIKNMCRHWSRMESDSLKCPTCEQSFATKQSLENT